MSWLSNLFGGGQSMQQAADPYLNQIPGVAHEAYDPYIQRGQEAGGVISDQFGKMSQDPSAFIDAIMKGYSQSPGSQFEEQQMSRAASNTAAAGGMRGSPLEQQEQQGITQGLLSKDMQQYLSNILGVQQTGLSGEQDLYGKGYDASKGLAGDLSNVLGTQAGLAAQGQREKQMQGQDWLKALMSGLGTVGGWSVGGPAGGTVGGNLANKLFS